MTADALDRPVLPDALTLGLVALRTSDPERLAPFYERAVGLARLDTTADRITLGVEGRPLVILLRDPTAQIVTRPAPGLFHLAVRVPDRQALAARLHALHALGLRYGASDHLVSEALYADDPDGNGVEIYRDRPEAEWPRKGKEIAMATLRLDVAALAAEISPPPAILPAPAGTDMGHVHLKVSDLPAARHFWCDVVGFALMTTYPGALFVAVGGYHHHLGLNIWHSSHAAPPPERAAGLAYFEIRLPAPDIQAVAARVTAAGFPATAIPGGVMLRDSSGNTAHLLAA